jgi:transcriptional regulator with XRE-family HTH domain
VSKAGMSMRRRRMARVLRQYRSAAGLTGDEAARALLCGTGTISRMENGESADPLRVRHALALYGAPPETIDDLVKLAMEIHSGTRGAIRRPYHDVVPKRLAEYYELEDEADQVSMVEGEFVPGLIQTEAYARALIGAGQSPDEVDLLVRIRMDRKVRLFDDRPLRLRVALGEAALHTQVGGAKVMREQLDYLNTLAREAPNVQIRVLPFAAGARPALGRNFTILSFPDETDPEVIFAESVTYFVLADETAEVQRFQAAYNRVWDVAMSETRSASLIASKIKG